VFSINLMELYLFLVFINVFELVIQLNKLPQKTAVTIKHITK
jgi:hypothetical protein